MHQISEKKQSFLNGLISTTKLINYPKIRVLMEEFPNQVVADTIKDELMKLRETLISTPDEDMDSVNISAENIESKVDIRVRAGFRPSIRPAINAAGIILHTALGRAPYAESARKALNDAVKNYCTLAVDVPSGKRGDRYAHVESLLQYLTGAEAACVTNNNAAAVLLVLNTLAKGKEVIISRGQLIEIGGAFRIPDIMEQSGAVMVDIGTTNRTHLFDYENAATEETAMIQFVHTSNYRVVGFMKEVERKDLSVLAKKLDIPLVEDIGSGALIDFRKYGLPWEPTVQDSLKAGVDIATFSGDKIVGGPQCGIIVGKKRYIDLIKKNPLCRAMRNDKMTYSVLEATLKLYLDEKTLFKEHPVLHMLTLPVKTIADRAGKFVRRIKPLLPETCEIKVVNGESELGSGSLPAYYIPSKNVSLISSKLSSEEISKRLRLSHPPVFTRIEKDRVLFDFRTIHPDETKTLSDVIIKVLKE